MKKLFIIANWKSNKNIRETEEWLHNFSDGFKRNPFSLDNKEVIVAPSFTLLEHANYCSGNLKPPIKLAAQTISPFGEGAFTGGVNGKQIKELADYVTVGHSERRKYFHEDEEIIKKKIEITFKYKLTPILCVSSIEQIINLKSYILNRELVVAYEPLFAIGSGRADTPQNANDMGSKIKEIIDSTPVLYGGSVTFDNVNTFTQMPSISGVLVGKASLDPLEFLEIIKNA